MCTTEQRRSIAVEIRDELRMIRLLLATRFGVTVENYTTPLEISEREKLLPADMVKIIASL